LANRADSYGALVVVWNRVDHRPLPLSRRRDRLVRLLAGKQLGIGLNEQTDAMGELVLRQACKMGLEGIVSKRLAASYRSGPSLAEDQKPGQLARICCSTIIEQTGRAVLDPARAHCWTAVGSSLPGRGGQLAGASCGGEGAGRAVTQTSLHPSAKSSTAFLTAAAAESLLRDDAPAESVPVMM
jgi:hypothetical protein